jgi:flagellar hook-length control protein FliK
MNLSSYLQMPPAPSVPNHTSNAVPQGPSAGVGSSAGGGLGFDFADVMARQLQRLVPQQRQTLAAEAPKAADTEARTQDSRPVEDTRTASKRSDDATRSTDQDRADAEEDNTDRPTAHTRQRNKGTSHATSARPDVDALLEGLMQGAPIAPAAAPLVAATDTTAVTDATASTPTTQQAANALATTVLANPASLQTVELSPQMRIITDPKAAPSPESLAAFAKSMGLDESAIQNLLAQQPPTPATGLATASINGLPPAAPNALQVAMSTVLSGGTQSTTPADGSVATQMMAMAATSEQPPVAVSGAGLAAPATTLVAPTATGLPGLTPTDMAAIQQLQITVLPAAVLPVNTQASQAPTPSTLDMLSLLGTGVDEQDVSALLSRFSSETGDTGGDSNPDQSASQGDGAPLSSFAQALNNTNKANNALPANAAQATNAHMSEVYDQLSDKMATEMAARMHKQLSDGEWKMKFALRPSNLGGVEIQLEMKDGKLDAVFRADNPLTRDLLQNSSQRLREALGNFGINAGQVNVGQGGGNAQHNSSGNSNRNAQVRDNSSSQVNGTSSASSASSSRSKANASLLDLYA